MEALKRRILGIINALPGVFSIQASGGYQYSSERGAAELFYRSWARTAAQMREAMGGFDEASTVLNRAPHGSPGRSFEDTTRRDILRRYRSAERRLSSVDQRYRDIEAAIHAEGMNSESHRKSSVHG
ncbi:MAG TPA: hypothetical protein VF285_11915 [Castellaniella sp.]|uniref:hypothetical protein n=1 Tax=Castellaniella sp. TaxID=1955812 RepID=UPI002EE286CA